ncbi:MULTISPECIES: signal peptidase II [Clostridium]|uniref:Lipoprotein signal peptidase n=8 Tax=Clostridium TaxID=1485 RepID=A5I1V4_CLOBH|nr:MULTISPECIES: signal peptidase II [Clostridium]EKN40419.1 lipoprotein signal peptidase [Clostridium botulinum CFSAN001627]EKX78104.1 lipoprotein signal peptidase [Clostridium botulinum CFSAN001628]EPS46872.1 lipoprotein signal peptidase [Clostridium botulinum CFSAN002367]EPS48368.1 lipoprotein signal peptidase [Clostridium botulinum CFSAN002369]KRU30418.1 lipoprotein signal peptidase [Clostridium sporogenes]
MGIIVLILGIFLDRISKIWALNTLASGKDIVVIKNLFTFSYLENRGAAFGIFQNRLIFLSLITAIVILGVVYFIVKYKPTSKLLKISLSLIISGAIGNLIDRIYYKFVVDFIMLHYKDVYYFPTFNVADMLVVIGTVLLAIYILKEE